MTGIEPGEPWKHLLTNPLDLTNTPALRNMNRLVAQPSAAMVSWESNPAFRHLRELTDRPLAGAGLAAFLGTRAASATETLLKIAGMGTLAEMYRSLAPPAFQFDPARFGFTTPTAMELLDPL